MVDTAALPEAERTALEDLVHASGFFALAAHPPAPQRPAPDARQLDLTITDERGQDHRVRLSEHAAPAAVRALVDRALAAPEA